MFHESSSAYHDLAVNENSKDQVTDKGTELGVEGNEASINEGACIL